MRINSEAMNFGKINTQKNPALATRTFGQGLQGGIGHSFDRLSLSQNGKTSSLVDSLNKQREQIQERKDELVASTKENGGNVSDIEAQLEAFDEQMKDLDKQISKATVDEMISKPTQSLVQKSQPKTSQDVQNSRMNQLVSLSSGLEQAKMANSAQNKLEGEANVLKAEMKKDGATESKLARVEEIEAQTTRLHKQVIDTLVEVNEQVEESKTESTTTESTNGTSKPEKSDKTDKPDQKEDVAVEHNSASSNEVLSTEKKAADFSTTSEYHNFLKDTYSSIENSNIKISDKVLEQAMSHPEKEKVLTKFLAEMDGAKEQRANQIQGMNTATHSYELENFTITLDSIADDNSGVIGTEFSEIVVSRNDGKAISDEEFSGLKQDVSELLKGIGEEQNDRLKNLFKTLAESIEPKHSLKRDTDEKKEPAHRPNTQNFLEAQNSVMERQMGKIIDVSA